MLWTTARIGVRFHCDLEPWSGRGQPMYMCGWPVNTGVVVPVPAGPQAGLWLHVLGEGMAYGSTSARDWCGGWDAQHARHATAALAAGAGPAVLRGRLCILVWVALFLGAAPSCLGVHSARAAVCGPAVVDTRELPCSRWGFSLRQRHAGPAAVYGSCREGATADVVPRPLCCTSDVQSHESWDMSSHAGCREGCSSTH